jgi:hypothetical protein
MVRSDPLRRAVAQTDFISLLAFAFSDLTTVLTTYFSICVCICDQIVLVRKKSRALGGFSIHRSSLSKLCQYGSRVGVGELVRNFNITPELVTKFISTSQDALRGHQGYCVSVI